MVAASQVLDNPYLSNTERACSLEASVTETAKGRRCFGVRVLERGRTGERTVAIGERTDAALDFGGTVLRSDGGRNDRKRLLGGTESKVKLAGGGQSGPRQLVPFLY